MTADVTALKAAVTTWAAAVHQDALGAMPDLMRPYAPLGKGPDAGQLRRSIARDPSAGGGGTVITGRIEAPVIQAQTTDQGSPAHIIRAKRGGLLFFYWPKIGRNIALPYVNHPGNAARPWWHRALQATYGPSLRFAAIRRSLR